jgi:hypothetical protein
VEQTTNIPPHIRAYSSELSRPFHLGGRGYGFTDRVTICQESAVTSEDKSRRIEVKDDDQTVAAAEVTVRLVISQLR